ncbi:epidermal growth factor-like protein 7 isoform X2 [Magallana gigas]|uniref:epidermal growth factor-like protein 7 isoform X2 n=1 Tax=Magallana gigas TaxID=29159 RepID=UPI00333F1EBF
MSLPSYSAWITKESILLFEYLTLLLFVTISAICSPACQNGGTCVQPNVCSCAPGWNGTFCESPLSACKPLAAPTNGQINCGDTNIFYQCTAQCNSGYEFDNGDTAIQKDCDPMTGQFCDGPAFPKNILTCSLACQNGKTCVQPNVCSRV